MIGWSTKRLLSFLDRVEPSIDELSHFDLLEVHRDADAKDIREAFYRKASTLHPDLYRLRISAEDHDRLTAVYARIANAYLVLRDPGARATYVRRMDESTQPRELEAALPPKARTLYRRARASLRMGDHTSAVLNLRMAVAAAPKSTLLRAVLNDVLGQAKKPKK